MSKCEECGRELALPFTCAYCDGYYCDEHRLPESHKCSNQPTVAPPFARPQTPSKAKVSPRSHAEPTEKPQNMEKPRARRHFPTKKVIGLTLIIVAIGILIYFSPTIISTIKNNTSQSSGLTLPLNQWVTYHQYSISYHFDVFSNENELWVAPTGTEGSTETFAINEGATYAAFTLDIKISEVHSDYIVIVVS